MAFSLILLAMILLSLFLYRTYRISSIPDIGDPFDVAAFEAIVVPASDNAAEIYAAADVMLVRGRGKYPSEDLDRVFESGWCDATEGIQKWLTENEPALDKWRRGTELPTAQFASPKQQSIYSAFDLVYSLDEFAHLARLRAERSLHEANVVEVWNWLRAGVRSTRHCQHGGFIGRIISDSTFRLFAQGINRWAADSRVDENLLLRAAVQFDSDEAMTPLMSEGLKSEYVGYLHSLFRDLSWSNSGMIATGVEFPGSGGMAFSFMFVLGEPEYSRRLMQHAFVGWIEQSDLPKANRTGLVSRKWGLIPHASKPGRLSTADLESRLCLISLFGGVQPDFSGIIQYVDREAACRPSLKLILAAQRYYRLHGDWPGKLDDLVPDFIKALLADPLGKAGETMLMRRDGDDLIIYSVADNGVDDGGAINSSRHQTTPDEGFRLKRPR